MPIFPEYITILLEGFSITRVPNSLVSEFDSGPAKQRRRSTRSQKIYSFTGFLCKGEYCDQLDQWWLNEINQGTDWFCFKDPRTGNELRARILNEQLEYQAEFNTSNDGLDQWSVDFQIEVWE